MSVITVRGPIEAAELGVTDIHEHILCDFSRNHEPDPARPELAKARVGFDTIGLLTHNPLAIPDNLILEDEQLAVAELTTYRSAGVRSVVEVTTRELGRDPLALRRISEATGLHIVACTGHYIHDFLPPGHAKKSVDELAESMSREILEGIDDSGVLEKISEKTVEAEFTEGSFPYLLLKRLIADRDFEALQTAYVLLQEQKR